MLKTDACKKLKEDTMNSLTVNYHNQTIPVRIGCLEDDNKGSVYLCCLPRSKTFEMEYDYLAGSWYKVQGCEVDEELVKEIGFKYLDLLSQN
ncbi:MAG: hypothetical protein JWN56_145 [Sphingobacteriales bacterium]|nr:hypothetical protein [Sphingobacteriales bacterium]